MRARTGEIELDGDDVRGLTIHLAERVMAAAGAGEVYASWATRELLADSPIVFVDRGLHELRGLAEQRRLYVVDPSG